MPRYLFIVSRQHQAVYDHLLAQFAGDAKAEVLLDRRRAKLRGRETPGGPDGRGADRRQRPAIDEELRRRAVAIVDVDP